jgi:hypothetical protein
MKCLDCPLVQTGEHFTLDIKNIQAITCRSNNDNSGYSNHILNTGHTYGTITDTVDVMIWRKKENFEHIRKIPYKISKDRLHINNTYIDTYNPIFETTIRGYTYNREI